MVVIENNSCPSGQKSMPLVDDNQEQGSYRLMVERTFKPSLKNLRNKIKGGLAVIYDKNPMEVSGYAKVISLFMQYQLPTINTCTHISYNNIEPLSLALSCAT